MTRRRFLTRAIGRRRGVEVSCERLYVHYVDAHRAGRVSEFLTALRQEVAGADEIRVTDREWLARDDFRRAVAPLIGR